MTRIANLRRSESSQNTRRQLPTFYYVDNFLEMVNFVTTHYAHLLSQDEADEIACFRALSQSAQCLFVRLFNRKGRVFETHRLSYPEIDAMALARADLLRCGLLAEPSIDDYERVLLSTRKADLVAAAVGSSIRASWNRQKCIDYVRRTVSWSAFLVTSAERKIVIVDPTETFAFIRYLFLGSLRNGTSALTLRDLGIVRAQQYQGYEARFASRDEARQAFYFAQTRQRLKEGGQQDVEQALAAVQDWPTPDHDVVCQTRDKLALMLGRIAEAQDRIALALRCYCRGESVACLKSAVRLFVQSGDRDGAKAHLMLHADTPRSDDTQAYAADTLNARFGDAKRSVKVIALANAETLTLDEYGRGAPERAVVQHYQASGLDAFRTENHLWNTLFGLTFWDLLFEGGQATGHSPFDRLPAGLSDRTFYAKAAQVIEQRLEIFSRPDAAAAFVRAAATQHYGVANGVFRWRTDMLEPIEALLASSNAAGVGGILRRMCLDYGRNHSGYPDVLLIERGRARFFEIKSPGDQVRRRQLLQIDNLRHAGFDADILRLEWETNPQQPYVVVDLETTGGRAASHRITEIGAVKMMNGEIVEQFSTFVNPMRPIPSQITRLTGISNAMVANAPVFADVAEEIRAFLDGAIFVAHNVNFDYGFLSHEFARLGQRFRIPKMCTCASMRKRFPGHASYSLKSLCRAYDIDLGQHHRALCDATAAAHLLQLVQGRRSPHVTAIT